MYSTLNKNVDKKSYEQVKYINKFIDLILQSRSSMLPYNSAPQMDVKMV